MREIYWYIYNVYLYILFQEDHISHVTYLNEKYNIIIIYKYIDR